MVYVVVVDTICEGWQAWGEASNGTPETFSTFAEAEAEIRDTYADLNKNRIESGMEAEEPEEFIISLSEYIQGRKAISHGSEPDG